MLKISLMDHSDLDSAYEIEKQVNPSPWSKDNFYSSFDVGHHSLVCKIDSKIIGFVIFSLIKQLLINYQSDFYIFFKRIDINYNK